MCGIPTDEEGFGLGTGRGIRRGGAEIANEGAWSILMAAETSPPDSAGDDAAEAEVIA